MKSHSGNAWPAFRRDEFINAVSTLASASARQTMSQGIPLLLQTLERNPKKEEDHA
ncbi:MAG: hypothetical protein P4N24_12285 [Acidobacteriota bacterium]|nr:hypothetical protein [Acidobacteriota bacterium]